VKINLPVIEKYREEIEMAIGASKISAASSIISIWRRQSKFAIGSHQRKHQHEISIEKARNHQSESQQYIGVKSSKAPS